MVKRKEMNMIRRVRVRRGLTVDEAARVIGCSTSTFYLWERGGVTSVSPRYQERLEAWLRG